PNAGLGWDDYNGNACSIDMTNGGTTAVIDPDVCLVFDDLGWYALVVYDDGGGNCYFDVYSWTGTQFTLSSSTQLLNDAGNGATRNSTINIDADAIGNFAIIWDDANTGSIDIQAGQIGLGPDLFRNGGSPQSWALANTSPLTTMPDLSLFYDQGNGN